MNRILKTLFIIAAAISTAVATNAQDLQSQRGESQDLGGLFGEKLDHGGLVINPTPQQLYRLRSIGPNISEGVVLKGEAKAFAEELSFLKQGKRGTKLTISYNTKSGELEPVAGAYSLHIGAGDITITAKEYKRPKPTDNKALERFFAWRGCIDCTVTEEPGENLFTPELAARVGTLFEKLMPLYDYFNQFKV